jgi:hypothetical protein
MNIGMGKLAVLAVAVAFAFGGVGAALADWARSDDAGAAIELASEFDARKNDANDDVAVAEDDDRGDGDNTRGNDGTSGWNNTGDGDWTAGNDGTAGGDNTGGGGGGGGGADTGGGGTGGGGTT